MAKDVKIAIVGDAKSAIAAFKNLDLAAMTSGQKMAAFGALGAGALVGVGVALFKLGSDFDDAYDKIRTGTGATGRELEGLKDDFRAVVGSVPTDFGQASDAISLIAQKLDLTGKPLQERSAQFLELSRITGTDLAGNLEAVTGTFQVFGVSAEEQGAKLDILFRASQESGVAVAELAGQMSSAAPQLQALGFSFDQATVLIAGMGKAGLDVADVMPALSKVMAVGAKEGKSAQEVYQGLIRSIKDAPDDVAASQVAFDTLGAKAGPKFAALIRSGQYSFDELGDTIIDGTDTIRGAGEQTMDFSEKFQMLKNKAFLALEPVATKVFELLGTGITWLSEHTGVLVGAAAVIGGLLVASFVAWAVSAAIAAATTLLALLPLVLMGAAIYVLYRLVADNWEAIKGAFQSGVDFISGAVSAIVGFFAGLPGRILGYLITARDWVVEKFREGKEILIGVLEGIGVWFMGLPDRIVAALGSLAKTLFDAGVDLVKGLIAGIVAAPSVASALANKIPGGSGAVSAVLGTVGLSGLIPHAAGGPVSAGSAYLVGEKGPEMFVSSRNGTIIPNGGGGGDIHVHLYISGSVMVERDLIAAVNTGVRKGYKLQTTP